jgi:uncharacterized protein YjdB
MKTSNRIKKACALFLAAALLVMQAPVSAFADTVNKITVTVYADDYTALDAGVAYHSTNGVILDGIKVKVDPNKGIAGALEAAAKAKGVPCINTASSYGGYYISSINGLAELSAGYSMSGWMGSINGDYNNYTLTTSDNGAVIRYHYSLVGYGTDINSYYNSSPTITSLKLAGQKINVTTLSGNGSGTKADPYVIKVPVAANTDLTSLKASYKTTLNKHYVKFVTDGGLIDISKTANYNKTVNCCLTGTDGTSKTYYSIKVKKAVSVSGVTLSTTKLSLVKGSSKNLTATVRPTNAGDKSLSYTSSNPSIAKVNGNGVITAKKAGSTVITVSSKDGSKKTATCVVTVKNPTVKFNVASMQIQKGKTTSALTAGGLLKGDSVQTYKSSNTAVVTVDAKGVLIAKKTGTATVSVTTKYGATANCKVTVQKSAVVTKSFNLASNKLTVNKGKTASISIARNPVNATDKIIFKSSNSKIASVDKTGVVTANKKGSCEVTIKTSSGVTQTVTIKVK